MSFSNSRLSFTRRINGRASTETNAASHTNPGETPQLQIWGNRRVAWEREFECIPSAEMAAKNTNAVTRIVCYGMGFDGREPSSTAPEVHASAFALTRERPSTLALNPVR